MDTASERNPQRAEYSSMPEDGDERPTEVTSPAEAEDDGAAESAGDSADRPDLRDPTNGSPYLTGQSTTSGLGGSGKETAGGGTGPRLDGGTVPHLVSDRQRQDG